ncbi:MAG: flavodoxin domain-containing protein [Candidatus Latescibacteria bacterium]|nr:flavodoxin domain-containing protein [Candidatus Latescibacterota bacterium]
MKTPFKAVKVTDSIYWVGAIDWNIKDFHGYATDSGTTYNAYLVLADKITLVDTVKAPFRDEMISRIASVVDPKNISVIISNHSEMDHTGCLPEVINLIAPDHVYASKMGLKAIKNHFHSDCGITVVEDGSTVSLGDRDISFIETRMLHWPDSMFSYLPGESFLFSQDAFGMHLASCERFADEIDSFVLEFEGAKYFANILMPYSKFITKLLERIGALNLDIKHIAPDHGPVWRNAENIRHVVGLYKKWAEQKPAPKAVITYDTMWQSTDKMARAIADGLAGSGIQVKLMSLQSYHRSDIATELLDSGAFVVGSPTLNNNVFPTIADAMVYLKGLKPVNLIGAAFGSYGWSGESIKHLENMLDEMKVDRVVESVKCEYIPDNDTLESCNDLGKRIAEKLKQIC